MGQSRRPGSISNSLLSCTRTLINSSTTTTTAIVATYCRGQVFRGTSMTRRTPRNNSPRVGPRPHWQLIWFSRQWLSLAHSDLLRSALHLYYQTHCKQQTPVNKLQTSTSV